MHLFEISIEKDISYITVDTKSHFPYKCWKCEKANPRSYDVNVIEIESLTGVEIKSGTGVPRQIYLFFSSSALSCPFAPGYPLPCLTYTHS